MCQFDYSTDVERKLLYKFKPDILIPENFINFWNFADISSVSPVS